MVNKRSLHAAKRRLFCEPKLPAFHIDTSAGGDAATAGAGAPAGMQLVTCPRCGTRFVVAEEVLGDADGRQVRCANCWHLWHYAAEADAPQSTAAGGTTPADIIVEPTLVRTPNDALATHTVRAEPSIDIRPEAPVLSAPEATATAAQERGGHRLAWAAAVGLIILAGGLAVAAVFERDRIEALYPPAARYYAMLHLGGVPGAGLQVTVTPTRRDGALVINGDIVNGATTLRRVPRLRITLVGDSKSDLASKVVDASAALLPPGATAHYTALFEHPANNAVRVDVTFATD